MKSELDEQKGKTLEEMSQLVVQLTNSIAEKKSSLAPIIKELRPLRQECQELTGLLVSLLSKYNCKMLAVFYKILNFEFLDFNWYGIGVVDKFVVPLLNNLCGPYASRSNVPQVQIKTVTQNLRLILKYTAGNSKLMYLHKIKFQFHISSQSTN